MPEPRDNHCYRIERFIGFPETEAEYVQQSCAKTAGSLKFTITTRPGMDEGVVGMEDKTF